jgi:cytoskeletal protein RodZ
MLAFFPKRLLLGAGIVVVGAVGVWWYGQTQYRTGVEETVTKFVTQDRETASNVREIAEQVLIDSGSTTDVDELLSSTGGLRD